MWVLVFLGTRFLSKTHGSPENKIEPIRQNFQFCNKIEPIQVTLQFNVMNGLGNETVKLLHLGAMDNLMHYCTRPSASCNSAPGPPQPRGVLSLFLHTLAARVDSKKNIRNFKHPKNI